VKDINHTFISLIPKPKTPIHPSNFRPISVCNVILKIITKTLANRVKSVLPSIITDHQSAFLSWRLIIDNTMLVLEQNVFDNATLSFDDNKVLKNINWIC